jgi:hypothetical protein
MLTRPDFATPLLPRLSMVVACGFTPTRNRLSRWLRLVQFIGRAFERFNILQPGLGGVSAKVFEHGG